MLGNWLAAADNDELEELRLPFAGERIGDEADNREALMHVLPDHDDIRHD